MDLCIETEHCEAETLSEEETNAFTAARELIKRVLELSDDDEPKVTEVAHALVIKKEVPREFELLGDRALRLVACELVFKQMSREYVPSIGKLEEALNTNFFFDQTLGPMGLSSLATDGLTRNGLRTKYIGASVLETVFGLVMYTRGYDAVKRRAIKHVFRTPKNVLSVLQDREIRFSTKQSMAASSY